MASSTNGRSVATKAMVMVDWVTMMVGRMTNDDSDRRGSGDEWQGGGRQH